MKGNVVSVITRNEIVAELAEQFNLTKKTALEIVNSFVGRIQDALRAGDTVTLHGLGTFSAVACAPRKYPNPREGGFIQTPGGYRLKFRAAKGLKDAAKQV